MIRTAKQYKEAKDFIDKELELYDYALSEKMTSYEYNLYLQDTQYCFNILYEKLRVLEDLIEYLDYYSKVKIDKAKKDIAEKEVVLSKGMGFINKKKEITTAITWEANPTRGLIDRDGETLDAAFFNRDYSITSGRTDTNHRIIKSITKSSNIECYSDNLENCISDSIYISQYNLEVPQLIEEELEVEITDPENFNAIDFEAINCEVEYLGKNDDNHLLLKIIADNMNKGYESFSHSIYKDSSLNSTAGSLFSYNRNNTVNMNQNALAEKLDENYYTGFIYNNRKRLSDNKTYENNSEVCYDYTH